MKLTEMPVLFEGSGATQTQKMTHARNHMKNLATKYGGMTIAARNSGNGFPGASGTHNGHTWTAKVSYGNASNGETFAKHEYTVDDEEIDPNDQWNVHKKLHDALNKEAPVKPKAKKKLKDEYMVVTKNSAGQKVHIAVFESNGESVQRGELLCCEQWLPINEFTNTCSVCGVNYKSNGEPIGSVYNRENDDDDDALSNLEKDVNVTEAEQFKHGDRVTMAGYDVGFIVPHGSTGTVISHKYGFGGESVHPDPSKLLVNVKWDHNGQEEGVYKKAIEKIKESTISYYDRNRGEDITHFTDYDSWKDAAEKSGHSVERDEDVDDNAYIPKKQFVARDKNNTVRGRFDMGTLFHTGYLPGNHIKEDVSPELKATLRKKYERNEDNNRHGENAVLLARHFGTPEEHEQAKKHAEQNLAQGYSSPESSQFNYEMSQKYFHKLHEGLNESVLTYIAIYGGKKIEFNADSLYAAKLEAIKRLSVPKAKQGLLSVMLAGKDGKEIIHGTEEL